MKIGLIDIGSNTSKLLIAELYKGPQKAFSILEQISLPCRLISQTQTSENHLGQSESKLLIQCLSTFQKSCLKHKTVQIKAVATEAFRIFSNTPQIIELIRQETGIAIRVLSGLDEARYVALGLQTDPMIKDRSDFTALDIGGGSIEFIQVTNEMVKEVASLPLGAVSVARKHPANSEGTLPSQCREEVGRFIRESIKENLSHFHSKPHMLVGTGGTLVFTRKILEQSGKVTPSGSLSQTDLQQLVKEVCDIPTCNRILSFPDLPKDRADIFPYGLLSVIEIMKFFKSMNLTHSYHNLRYGLLQEMLGKSTDQ